MKNTTYQNTFIAKTFAGLEQVLAEELRQLGSSEATTLRRGVVFRGDQQLLYRANIWSRCAISILRPLSDFSFSSRESFYENMQAIDWTGLFSKEKTISVIATAHESEVFNNTMFLAQLSKDAIVDSFSAKYGSRPDVDSSGAQVRIVVNVMGDSCKVSLDSSGDALFKRGYRRATGQAPINEVLAAGLIKLSGWDSESPFFDPMCGSGTFPIEAALMSANIAPGKDRKVFGFSHWNDFDPKLLKAEKERADDSQTSVRARISASDIMGNMLDIVRHNVMDAGLLGSIEIRKQDFFSLHPRETSGVVMINPPYGHRMNRHNVKELYAKMGDSLKHRFAGFRAGVISAELEAIGHLGLKPEARHIVFNGPLKCTFNIYDLFKGRRNDYKAGKNTGTRKRIQKRN